MGGDRENESTTSLTSHEKIKTTNTGIECHLLPFLITMVRMQFGLFAAYSIGTATGKLLIMLSAYLEAYISCFYSKRYIKLKCFVHAISYLGEHIYENKLKKAYEKCHNLFL
jgi:hypothetical protein